jgi:pimeloyl-ACP methyl ester carboxylesterase
MSPSSVFAGMLARRSLGRDHHAALDYYIGGEGAETIAIVNAYGQSLAFWEPFVARMAKRYRILLWQPRGTLSAHGGQAGVHAIDEHVLDMWHLLATEGIAQVHVLGWCTGPKTALAFSAAHPARVRSIVSLTGCFLGEAALPALRTRYETAMNDLCRMIDQRPQVAPQLAGMFKSVLVGQRPVAAQTPEAQRIAALVQAPFATPESIVHYARQLLSFWGHGIASVLPNIDVPALFIGGGCDDVAHPGLSREVASRVPGAAYVHVAGGSHYLHVDRADLLCALAGGFIDDPYGFGPDSLDKQDGAVAMERFDGVPSLIG